MDSWLLIRGCGVIFNQWTKSDDRSFKWFTKSPFVWCFSVRQFVLNISEVEITFHGIRPPIFVQSWLQQYRSCPFFNNANYSLSNPTVSEQIRGWCAMIPRKVFRSFANFQVIVSVNDFWHPWRLHELLQAPFSFLWGFSFTRIRLDPLGGQVLHQNCISMIVSPFTENFVIGCNQITKIFWTKHDSTSTSSPDTTRLSGSKEGSWEELACESLRTGTLAPWSSGTLPSTRCSLNSCSHSGISEKDGSLRSCAWSSILLVFEFLGWVLIRVSPFVLICSLTINRYWNRCWTCTFLW